MKKAKGYASLKRAISRMRLKAKQRGYSWELSYREAKVLVTQDCYYCGRQPSNYYHKPRANGGSFYTGLDRVDNSKGYTLDNVVPCCKWCNYGKRDRTVAEWIEHCKSVAERW